jgi:pimeloyl-ACP methyl ester carboxylesterase
MNTYFFMLIFAMSLMPNNWQTTMKTQTNFKLITYKTEDGGNIEGSLFEGSKDLAVVFAHGAIFDKESWYFLCEKLQSKNVTSLSIDFRGYGNSKKGSTNNKALDILGAIDYLKGQGFKTIALVGGSMGGAATLNALELKTDGAVKKVVLLSPAGGHPIASNSVKKLIVVSKDEGLFARVNAIFKASADPKELKVYEGSYHAQHMFKSNYADELTHLIIDFLTN